MDKDTNIEKTLKEIELHQNEELPPGVTFDGEHYIIDEDEFEGW